MDRKTFLNQFALLGAGAALMPSLLSAGKQQTIDPTFRVKS